MSQIPTDNDDNSSVAANDFDHDHPDEVPDQQQEEQPQFGFHQNPLDLDWTLELDSEYTHNDENDLKVMKWMMANLQAKNQTLQEKMKNLELEARLRAIEENAEHNAKYQALETKVNELAQMLTTQNEEHHMEMAQLETKNRKLEKKVGSNQRKMDYMWGQLMMSKRKILAHPKGIVWDRSQTDASISECGLKLKASPTSDEWIRAITTKGYALSAEHCRKENFQFPGTIIFYYEVTITNQSPNCYGLGGYDAEIDSLWLSGKKEELECQTGAIARANVVGSGLLLNSKDELAVFFTLNGILLVEQTPINPTVHRLYPTAYFYHGTLVETNFGDNIVVKPFKFDTDKCPGLVFE